MRPSALAFAISLALLAACSQTRPNATAGAAQADESRRERQDQLAGAPQPVPTPEAVAAQPSPADVGKVESDAVLYEARDQAAAASKVATNIASPIAPPPPPLQRSAGGIVGFVSQANTEHYAEHKDNPTQITVTVVGKNIERLFLAKPRFATYKLGTPIGPIEVPVAFKAPLTVHVTVNGRPSTVTINSIAGNRVRFEAK
jgi:hypothetical protein